LTPTSSSRRCDPQKRIVLFFIIELAKRQQIRVVTVAHALAEAERNIAEKLGDAKLTIHYENLLAIRPTVQSLAGYPLSLERRLAATVPEKDVPIVLGAVLSGADALITLDRRHLLENKRLHALKLPIPILTPGDFLQNYLP